MALAIIIVLVLLFVVLAVAASGIGSESAESEKKTKAGKYLDKVGPGTPRVVAKWRRKTLEAQMEAQIAANNAARAALEATEIEDGFAKGIELSDEAHLNAVLNLKEERQDIRIRGELTRLAADHGMDLLTFLQVTSRRELSNIDLQTREIEYKQDQEQISRVQQEPLELVDRATHRLFSMYEQRKKLENSRDRAKDDKLRQLNYNIQIAEELIRGEQARYLEAQIGQTKAGSLSAADERGRSNSEEGEAEEPKRGPGRPRGSKNRSSNK